MSKANALTGGAVLTLSGASDPGKSRDHNEDSLLVDPELGLVVVADGLGGHNAGEVASEIVTQVLAYAVRRRLLAIGGEHLNAVELEAETLELALRAALVDAHAEVLEAARAAQGRSGMASTVVALLVHGGTAVLGWVGDSPAYRFQGGRLGSPLTRSHNLSQDSGRPPGNGGSGKSLLTRVMGGGDNIFMPDTLIFPVCAGETYLLCSDGLTDMVSDTEIGEILRASSPDLEHASGQLIQAANRAGGEDNITVALLRVDQAPRSLIERGEQARHSATDTTTDHTCGGQRATRPGVWLGLAGGLLGILMAASGGWWAGAKTTASDHRQSRAEDAALIAGLQSKLQGTEQQLGKLRAELEQRRRDESSLPRGGEAVAYGVMNPAAPFGEGVKATPSKKSPAESRVKANAAGVAVVSGNPVSRRPQAGESSAAPRNNQASSSRNASADSQKDNGAAAADKPKARGSDRKPDQINAGTEAKPDGTPGTRPGPASSESP